MLPGILNKYKFLFDRNLVTWNSKHIDIELQPGAKPYHAKPYMVPLAHEAVYERNYNNGVK